MYLRATCKKNTSPQDTNFILLVALRIKSQLLVVLFLLKVAELLFYFCVFFNITHIQVYVGGDCVLSSICQND